MGELYLKRKIDDYLAHWKKDIERKPLMYPEAKRQYEAGEHLKRPKGISVKI